MQVPHKYLLLIIKKQNNEKIAQIVQGFFFFFGVGEGVSQKIVIFKN